MTPKIYTTTDGTPFPATVLDDRAGVESRPGVFQLAPDEIPVERLPADVFKMVQAKAAEGTRALEAGDLPGAWHAFVAALKLLPEPVECWNATGWLLVAMGESQFRGARYAKALGPLQDAMICPGTLGNPWVHLRLGQARYEVGEMHRAADDLARAYLGGDREIFDDQDPKYFELVREVLKLDDDK